MLVALIICLIIVIIGVLKNASESTPEPAYGKSAQQKRTEIIAGYKQKMDEELSPYLGDKEALQAKKTQLLREFSIEVSSNIFFGANEVRDVISELAHYGAQK